MYALYPTTQICWEIFQKMEIKLDAYAYIHMYIYVRTVARLLY